MNDRSRLTQHELFELNGLMAAEVTSAKKLESAIGFVNDHELADFIKKLLAVKRCRIDRMQQLVKQNLDQFQAKEALY